jgi:hypothetical protein
MTFAETFWLLNSLLTYCLHSFNKNQKAGRRKTVNEQKSKGAKNLIGHAHFSAPSHSSSFIRKKPGSYVWMQWIFSEWNLGQIICARVPHSHVVLYLQHTRNRFSYESFFIKSTGGISNQEVIERKFLNVLNRKAGRSKINKQKFIKGTENLNGHFSAPPQLSSFIRKIDVFVAIFGCSEYFRNEILREYKFASTTFTRRFILATQLESF